MTYDARAIGNLILDEAERDGFEISNLILQKLLYFSHGAFLLQTGEPLVKGYFEAWQFGPVHPTAYEAFKSAGEKPIKFRARRLNPITRGFEEIARVNERRPRLVVSSVVNAYGGLGPGRLVDLSHAPNAPWAFVVENSKLRPMLGLRISDNLIRERFRYHKVSIGVIPRSGEPDEDAPFASD
ncbi:MAG: type II toxin-antitoxin system antitoxin SocA domain-containing protein [Fimbriimonadaceae bacterium]